ncbi:hypothetical protein COU54_01560 [Candidatus Pacearchaeota archaeon CG10_big_fil_rev_8_21_14_0_10_31_24]|nr:MAG: hypothetical protein COU54_01560 [Candidatus Pacearchaeota archaeon CG10_big_fil_rev_8_21_14_0_10_31_24]
MDEESNIIKIIFIGIIIAMFLGALIFMTIIWYNQYYNKIANPSLDILKNETSTTQTLLIEDLDPYSNTTEMHWDHLPLTYSHLNCTEKQTNRTLQAMEFLNNRTSDILAFIPLDIEKFNKSDITFVCHETGSNELAIGEAIPHFYNNTLIYAPSQINIYKPSHCIGRRPTIEIHELLHLFGLGHVEAKESTWKDIMNPYATRCEADISEKDLTYLLNIYNISQ